MLIYFNKKLIPIVRKIKRIINIKNFSNNP